MRYGNPSIRVGARPAARGAVASASSSCRSIRSTRRARRPRRSTPSARTSRASGASRACACVDRFHDDPGYIQALARNLNDDWVKNGRPDHLVLSFHGLPQRSLQLGDPYHCHCHATGAPARAGGGPRAERSGRCRSSRASGARSGWSRTPSTCCGTWPKQGIRRVDVYCPGFVADCLETLEEIGLEGKRLFLAAGGRSCGSCPASTSTRRGSPRWRRSPPASWPGGSDRLPDLASARGDAAARPGPRRGPLAPPGVGSGRIAAPDCDPERVEIRPNPPNVS